MKNLLFVFMMFPVLGFGQTKTIQFKPVCEGFKYLKEQAGTRFANITDADDDAGEGTYRGKFQVKGFSNNNGTNDNNVILTFVACVYTGYSYFEDKNAADASYKTLIKEINTCFNMTGVEKNEGNTTFTTSWEFSIESLVGKVTIQLTLGMYFNDELKKWSVAYAISK